MVPFASVHLDTALILAFFNPHSNTHLVVYHFIMFIHIYLQNSTTCMRIELRIETRVEKVAHVSFLHIFCPLPYKLICFWHAQVDLS